MLREVAIMTALEKQELRKSLDELTTACVKIQEYIGLFDRAPPMNAKVWADFRGALSVAEALLGRETVDV